MLQRDPELTESKLSISSSVAVFIHSDLTNLGLSRTSLYHDLDMVNDNIKVK